MWLAKHQVFPSHRADTAGTGRLSPRIENQRGTCGASGLLNRRHNRTLRTNSGVVIGRSREKSL